MQVTIKNYGKNWVLKLVEKNLNLEQPLKNPVDSEASFEIIPDPVHVFKSLVQGWLKNEEIILPKWIVSKLGLCSNIVDVRHLRDLVEFEKK